MVRAGDGRRGRTSSGPDVRGGRGPFRRTPDGRFEGRDAARQYIAAQLTGFPDAAVSLGRRCEDGDLYLGEFTVRGTNTGAMSLADGTELPATGRTVELPGTEVVRERDGKIVEHDMLWDRLSVLEQLGLLPAT